MLYYNKFKNNIIIAEKQGGHGTMFIPLMSICLDASVFFILTSTVLVQFCSLGLFLSVRSTLVQFILFGPLWSIGSISVHFVSIWSIQSTLILFGLFSPNNMICEIKCIKICWYLSTQMFVRIINVTLKKKVSNTM